MTREQIEHLIEYREARLNTMLAILRTITNYEPHELVEAISDEENVIAALRRLLAVMPRTGPVPEEMRLGRDYVVVQVRDDHIDVMCANQPVEKYRWVPASAIFPKEEVKP